MVDIQKIKTYFQEKFKLYGATPQGIDWNSRASQETRFEQLSKIIDQPVEYSIIDYGCGYGSLYNFLQAKGHKFKYTGFDIVEEMVIRGKELHPETGCIFLSDEKNLKPSDYVIESGIFNIKQDIETGEWEKHIVQTLEKMNHLSKKGMAFNMLTKYSDPEFMRPDLYYADPCFFFDLCKKNFSKEVALLHDYQLYDFTILIRK